MSYANSLGEVGVHVLPCNQSTLFADSKTRENNQNSTPTNFTMNCDRVRMKEFYYSTLFWKQSLYTHNCTNCELKYRMTFNSNTSPIYVVYAMPFVSYTSFDGNPEGSVYAVPNTNVVSYARQMEYALNNDYRLFAKNTQVLAVGSAGYSASWLAHPNDLVLRFRYNSTKGFALWAETSNPLGVTIEILQCDWVQNGHDIHGFGYPYSIYQPTSGGAQQDDGSLGYAPVYGPNPHGFVSVYYAESLPTLLPTRYIAILSPELTKDRRIPSFHSANVNMFNSEIAIFAVSLKNNCVWHSDVVNEDSTVVSIRDDYCPQQVTFQIVNDNGKILQMGQNLFSIMTSPSMSGQDLIGVVTGVYGGNRLPPYMMSHLIFNVDNYNITVPVPSINVYGPYDADVGSDDVAHEVVVIIRDN